MNLPPRVVERKANGLAFQNGNEPAVDEPMPGETADVAETGPEEAPRAMAEQSPESMPVARLGAKGLKKRPASDLAESAFDGEDEENLPVLRAFREFLEVERRRARRAIGLLTVCFVAVIVIIAGAGLLIGRAFYVSMQEQIARSQQEIAKSRQDIEKAGGEIQAMRALVDSETQRLGKELEDGNHKFDVARSGIQMLDTKITATAGDIGSVKTELMRIQQLQDTKTDSFAMIAERLDGLAARIETLSKENALLRDKITTIGIAPGAKPVEKSVENIPLNASTSNIEETINWRLPMPEL